GLMNSLFRDVPKPLAMLAMQPFRELMHAQTGVTGELKEVSSPEALAQQLADDDVQVGVFHGFEFAWARLKHPELQPLMIAVNQQRLLHAYLVVRADCSSQCLEELQGKTLALPKFTREYTRLFLERTCLDKGLPLDRLFG